MPFYTFLGEGSPTKLDYRKKGILILTSLLEDLGLVVWGLNPRFMLMLNGKLPPQEGRVVSVSVL